VRREHLADGRFGQILQPHVFGALDELMEVDRQVGSLEVLVKEIRVGERPSRSASPRNNWLYGPASGDADTRNVSSARACSTCSFGSANCPAWYRIMCDHFAHVPAGYVL